MAAPTYATDLTDVEDWEGTIPAIVEFSGYAQGDGGAAETDWYLQGSQCISDEANNKTGVGHSLGVTSTTWTYATGDHFFAWMMCQGPNAMDTYQNGGYRVLIGDSTTTFGGWKVGGSNFGRNPYGGWTNVVVDPTKTVDYGTQPTTGTMDTYGVAWNMAAGISKGRPLNADVFRGGRGQLSVIDGDGTNGYGTFSGMAGANDATTARWGLFQDVGGSYLWKGLMSLGTTTAVDFRDSNAGIAVDNTPQSSTGFNKIEINNASSRVDWTAVTITAPATAAPGESVVRSPGSLEVVDNADVNFDSCSFIDMTTFIFKANSSILNTTFQGCGLVTANGADFSGSTFTDSTSSSSLLWNTDANTDGKLDDCTFNSDGSNHAIEITALSTVTSITLRGVDFTGYATSNGSTGNEAIYVNIASGTFTINAVGCTGDIFYRTAGATVSIVADPVSVKVKTVTATGTNIQSANVFLETSEAGGLPYNASVTISNSGTTATVTHNAHGLVVGDKVVIRGASHNQNNGVQTIVTVPNANSYTYTMGTAPGSSPTGTITSGFVFVAGLTDVNGEISASRVIPSNQGATGRARKSSSAPFYKNSPLTGTVSSTVDTSFTAVMISDD